MIKIGVEKFSTPEKAIFVIAQTFANLAL